MSWGVWEKHMPLLYKEDWDEYKELYKAWWDGELRGALLQLISPKQNVVMWRSWDSWAFVKYNDPVYVVKSFESWCKETYFGGAAFPNLWINFGPGILGAMLGSQFIFTGDTVWFKPPEKPFSLREICELELDFNNKWWVKVKQATETASMMSKGRFVVGITDIGGVLDVMASLRGTLNLIKDMFVEPKLLEEAIMRILGIWHECYEELLKLMPKGGMSSWMGIWCPSKWYPIQCDLAYILSPKLFKKFVIPHIREHCLRLDYTIYHLDGPNQLPHVDTLLEIEELTGIQWVPGAAMSERGHHGGSSIWLSLYRKIQKRGKRLVLGVPLTSVKFLLDNLSPRGLLLSVSCYSKREADKLMERVPKNKIAKP